VFFPLHGILIVNKGYLLADGLLLLAEIFFISCFFRLQLLGLSSEGALEFILGLYQLLFRSPLLFLFGTKHLRFRGFQFTFLAGYFVLEMLAQLVDGFVLRA
jgi:hypothetical protein